ncbi:sialidase family protein [Nitrospira defluvii]|uniref:Sialidase domain-containing protein n=1 Tax=Nitrospira defluvii TaxID=330214 RepID=A0ABN7MBY8_9BACT|nr:sialidase family protein [Nitrospira defluvii]CAE6797016.1 Sialidase domain-containing protein [Nitrospira defluvii]
MFARALSFFGTAPQNVRVSDFTPGRAQAGTLSAGQRGLAIGSEGMAVAVWSDTREGKSNIYLVKSRDGGRTFGSNVRVNDVPGTAGLFGATVALDRQDRAHIVWFDNRDGDYDIYFAREAARGDGFTAAIRINDDKDNPVEADVFGDDEPDGLAGPAFQTLPSLAVDRNGAIYAAWQDYRRNQADIYFAKSIDGGKTFTENLRVNDDVGRAGQLYPSLAVDAGGTIYLAWHDFRKGNQDIYFSRSTDGGKTFSRNVRVNDDPGTDGQFNPSLAVDDGGAVYVAWHDLREGQADIYFARSIDGGQTFSPNRKLNDDRGETYQFHPSLGAGVTGAVAVAWEDYRNGQADIYLAYSADGGNTFRPNVRVNSDRRPADHLHAGLAVGAHKELMVIWEDQRDDRRGGPSVCQPVRCSDVYASSLPYLRQPME